MGTQMVIITAIFLGFLNCVSSECSDQEKMRFIAEDLEPACQSSVQSILQVNSQLDGVDFDSACTTNCMGRYADWLENVCEDAYTGKVARIACLESETASRCRTYFPDVANKILFIDTAQCAGPLFTSGSCTGLTARSGCRASLNTLIDTLGCCFLSLYNDTNAIASLKEKSFLTAQQSDILISFHMSEVLEECIDEDIPQVCSSSPFLLVDPVTSSEIDVTDNAAALSSNMYFSVAVLLHSIVSLINTT